MSSPKQQEISTQLSEVSRFYAGKSLFITGAAGFLGTVLLEALLRCCPDIHRIYILLRPKNGAQPEDRKESIFKKEIFHKIREKNPDALNKVQVVSGDISLKNLGMSLEDIHRVCQEVTIVFHCAAVISFVKSLKFTMQQNVLGTYNTIQFCRKLNKLEAFMYTSTAYSNCNLSCEIEEKVYPLPFTADEVLTALKNDSEEELQSLLSKCKPPFPNYYTFSKFVAETLVAEKASDMVTCIVRPSIIVCCRKSALPGYIEDGSGLVSLCLGVGKGFIRVLLIDPEIVSNQIPADVVANTLIVAAYHQIVESLPSPSVYNCVASEKNEWTWREFADVALEMAKKHPLPNRMQEPSVILCKSEIKYWVISAFEHYAPALVIDFFLWVNGRKPRLYKLYRFYDTCVSSTKHFAFTEWAFRTDNFRSLGEKTNAIDKELFPVELDDFNLEEIAEIVPKGAPMYNRDNSSKASEKQRRHNYVPRYLISVIKCFLVGFIASAFYVAVF